MTTPPSWFCRWAKLLLGSSPWVLDIGNQPIKTSVLPCCKPLLPSLWQSDSKWSSPEGPPGYFCGMRPELELPRNNPQFWRTSILGSFPPGKNRRVRGAGQPRGGVVQSACSGFSYPLNAICPGLCDARRACFSLTPVFQDLLSGVLSMNSCQLFFSCWGAKSGSGISMSWWQHSCILNCFLISK